MDGPDWNWPMEACCIEAAMELFEPIAERGAPMDVEPDSPSSDPLAR
ncbi:MAG: hypothetical protein ACXIUZ_15170 [Lysobacteraceae bacterium]|jgi:hypothetical protein